MWLLTLQEQLGDLGGETTIVCLELRGRPGVPRTGSPQDWEEIPPAVGRRNPDSVFARRSAYCRRKGKAQEDRMPAMYNVYDDKGFNPKFDLEDTISLEGDVLIVTVGQGPDKQSLQSDDLLDEKGRLAVDPMTLQARKRNGFLSEEISERSGFMVDAMKDGLVASESIERYLKART